MCTTEENNLDCFGESLPLKGISCNHINNLCDLSSDMKYLLQGNLMTDIVLSINGDCELFCHKDILKFRSKWFYNAVCQADAKGAEAIEVNEDPRVMEGVLCYIYTGDLRLLESMNIYLLEVYEAAEKYGFSRLREILGRILQEKEYRKKRKYKHFVWTIKVEDDGSILDVDCSALNNFTISGNDKWQLRLKCINSSKEDDCSNIVLYLDRKTHESCTTVHSVHLTIGVSDCQGKCRLLLTEKLDFRVDGEYSLKTQIPLKKLKEEYTDLLSNGLLTLTCELQFLSRPSSSRKFKLTGSYRKYIFNELVHLSEDMFNVFRDGRTHDISFSRCHVKIHNYILLVRSRIPKDFLCKLEERTGFGKRLWMSFASFLYTGQSRFLEEHAMAIYSALSEMALMTAKEKYSKFLSRNITLENAFYILNEAVSYEDDSLSLAAANSLASESGIESDPQRWIQMVREKRNLLNLLPQSYIYKQIL